MNNENIETVYLLSWREGNEYECTLFTIKCCARVRVRMCMCVCVCVCALLILEMMKVASVLLEANTDVVKYMANPRNHNYACVWWIEEFRE
uniref:Uncharacterized protein n=1 Tax=Octopus bimaculoides TaxID=37653 RepID=A0A0L8I180_OCTBM